MAAAPRRGALSEGAVGERPRLWRLPGYSIRTSHGKTHTQMMAFATPAFHSCMLPESPKKQLPSSRNPQHQVAGKLKIQEHSPVTMPMDLTSKR